MMYYAVPSLLTCTVCTLFSSYKYLQSYWHTSRANVIVSNKYNTHFPLKWSDYLAVICNELDQGQDIGIAREAKRPLGSISEWHI